ncbi:MAG TPA: hypothetical protein VHH73_09075 [Verrucomicrobiae bacterium]|nr:hypothetical protein [Verrucomicrobiae bacterium]
MSFAPRRDVLPVARRAVWPRLRAVTACKLAVIQARAEAKDYLDIAALIDHGIPLPEMLGAAQAVYGRQFNALISLKTLALFIDGGLARAAAGDPNQIEIGGLRGADNAGIDAIGRRPGSGL